MLTSLLFWFAAVWISCAPANPSSAQSGNALEQMEAEIARIVEQVRPSVVGVSVTRKRSGAMGLGQSWGAAPEGSYRIAFSGSGAPQIAGIEEPIPAPEPIEIEMDDEELDRMTDEAERLAELAQAQEEHAHAHAEKLSKEAELLEDSANDLRERLLTTAATARSAWGGTLAGKSIGSGFAIEGGYVVTTHTIAAGGEDIVLSLADGKEAKGKLVGSDDATDIALIKLEASAAPGLKLGDSGKCRVGSIGVFLSRSYGKLDNVDFGLVTGREEAGGGEMLRMNFPIRPGESGSPLLNARGEVIGIASANLRKDVRVFAPSHVAGQHGFTYTMEAPEAWGGESSREFSYFIPAERVKAVIEDLKQYGEVRRAWFGVSGTDTTIKISASEKQRGVLIEEVIEDSSALKAGIQVGDILLRCNGQPTPNFSSLRAIIEKLPVGKTVKVTVRRSGKEVELDVTPQARPSASKMQKGGNLGLSLVPKSKELASYLNLADSPDGKVVASVAKDSLAERAGIRKGDLLLEDPKPGKVTRIWRDGKTIEVAIPAE